MVLFKPLSELRQAAIESQNGLNELICVRRRNKRDFLLVEMFKN